MNPLLGLFPGVLARIAERDRHAFITRPPTTAEAAAAMAKRGARMRYDTQHALVMSRKADLDRDYANGIVALLGPRGEGKGR